MWYRREILNAILSLSKDQIHTDKPLLAARERRMASSRAGQSFTRVLGACDPGMKQLVEQVLVRRKVLKA